jgi:hypothetical protein
LSAEERAMYGHLYDAHEYAVSERNRGLGDPEEAAKLILAVLRTPDPETRYTVGKPAAFLCALPKTKSDREVDVLVNSHKVWEGAGV